MQLMAFDYDIVISGGGIVGLTAAVAFGGLGFSVLCADPAPLADAHPPQTSADLRSTALLQPTRRLFENIGLWDEIAGSAMPLQTMRIIDAGDIPGGPHQIRDFHASDLSNLPFAWNVSNTVLRQALMARVQQMRTVDLRMGVGSTDLFTRLDKARVTLTDGTYLHTRLVLAADGRGSPMRRAAGIDVRTARYGQKALTFFVNHDTPHKSISTEIHRSGGPFTLVPLPDFAGAPASAVVWMDAGEKQRQRAALPIPDFEAQITARSCDVSGPLRLASQRTLWPIITQHATHLTARRLALIGEAAHVVPPIGAQGLNISLTDLRVLMDLAAQRPEHLGEPQMLHAYEKSRRKDITARMAGIDMLNRVSQAHNPLPRYLRRAGLAALHRISPLRLSMMRLGLGE